MDDTHPARLDREELTRAIDALAAVLTPLTPPEASPVADAVRGRLARIRAGDKPPDGPAVSA